MKRTFAAAAVFAFLTVASSAVSAADNSVPEFRAATKNDQLFKAVCIGEKSTGFNWSNNEWHFARFKPEKYFIEKLKPERSARTLLCWSDAQEKKRHETTDMALDWGCYSVREGEHGHGLAQLCLEEWKTINDKLLLQTVLCQENDPINFVPDGEFTAVQWKSAALTENVPYKDSLSVTVGRCSIIH
jgi:hypothetical protein